MVPNNEWYQAPLDVPIFGLKELEESEYVLLTIFFLLLSPS